eukprot:7376234-Lingulodinium_polyedra.AAC.1
MGRLRRARRRDNGMRRGRAPSNERRLAFPRFANGSRDRCDCTMYRKTRAIRIPIIDLRSAV